ncbi:MAG TPA: NHL repeat-containing protein [Lacipirellulaceae bacterium]
MPRFESHRIDRREFGRLAAGSLFAATVAGCSSDPSSDDPPDVVWGKLGAGDGQFSKPRAIAIDADDHLYIVDMTARIQVFDADGKFIRGWRTPEHANGRPTGLTISTDGNLLVADTHYYRVLTYTPKGELLEEATLGGTMGPGPGEFGFVTDAVRDAAGNYFVSEYGEFDRIQKFSPDGKFLLEWGGHGSKPGEFLRPQHLELDADGLLWVADACNHRIQVFDGDGKVVKIWGTHGTQPGQLSYPYSLALDGEGYVYVCEYGNHRVQKLTLDGESVACWGREGRRPGQLFNPWALVLDSRGRLHVLDSNNHRVQRIVL